MTGLSRRTIARIAENRIRAAIERGEFDGLPAGAPIAGLDEPYDPQWWVKRWLRREAIASSTPCDRRRGQVAAVELLREARSGTER